MQNNCLQRWPIFLLPPEQTDFTLPEGKEKSDAHTLKPLVRFAGELTFPRQGLNPKVRQSEFEHLGPTPQFGKEPKRWNWNSQITCYERSCATFIKGNWGHRCFPVVGHCFAKYFVVVVFAKVCMHIKFVSISRSRGEVGFDGASLHCCSCPLAWGSIALEQCEPLQRLPQKRAFCRYHAPGFLHTARPRCSPIGNCVVLQAVGAQGKPGLLLPSLPPCPAEGASR